MSSNQDWLLNKFLPVIVVFVMAILLSVILFIVLFDYIETRQVYLLKDKGDVVPSVDDVYKAKPYVFPPEVLEKLQPDPNVEPYVFPPEVLEKLQPDPNVEPYIPFD